MEEKSHIFQKEGMEYVNPPSSPNNNKKKPFEQDLFPLISVPSLKFLSLVWSFLRD